MIDYKLLVLAFNNQEWNTVAYLMIGLYGEYVEGHMDSSAVKFNKVFPLLPVSALKIMSELNPGFDMCFVNYRIPKAKSGILFNTKI